ncbi:capsular polysaccharide export protein, LipB/KpsS family [Edwardsiella tarda]|uniref:capsular polysaccharide export protein, LipB/KpsS family n=1 Tax=Edwardsiella tarda TaxID=636 RepID=UPI003F65D2E8
MIKIGVYLDCLERFYFFRRFESNPNYQFYFLTTRLSVFFSCKKNGVLCFLVRKHRQRIDRAFLCDSTDVVIGNHSLNNASKISSSIMHCLENYFHDVAFFIIWNGETTSGKTVAKFCDLYKVKKVFVEISNLPNSIFVDSMGVNAKSSLFFDASILDNMIDPRGFDINEWLLLYEEYKRKPLPQSLNIRRYNFYYIIDFFWGASFGVVEFSLFSKFRNVFSLSKRQKIPLIDADLSCDYIFLPLQVSTDSQLVVNSDYTNLDMIDIAIKHARENNIKLYVKPHPAEKDCSYLRHFMNFGDVLFVSNNTNELIKNCSALVVNNSTVGLEGMIYNKKVHIYGRCFYKGFTQERLKKYISSYLVNGVDYFSDEKIPYEILQCILSKGEM